MKPTNLNFGLPSGFTALVGLLITITGCSVLKPKANLTQFYVLRAHVPATNAEQHKREILPEVRVGPGSIAGYLNTTPIAIQAGTNRVEYLDVHHWAEPLNKALGRVLAEDLAATLHVPHIAVYPEPPAQASGFEVRYTVNRFEGELSGPVTLDVSWQIVERPSAVVVSEARSEYVVAVEGQAHDVPAYVNRLSTALGTWANDLAPVIRSRPTP